MPDPVSVLASYRLSGACVWVLAPQLEKKDAHIDYYYDFTQSIAEYTRTFEELQFDWKWQPVTMETYTDVIAGIEAEQRTTGRPQIVFNICDGDEINGAPGISVVRLLEEKKLIYTGADAGFYHITTSKIPMKKAFDAGGVPTAPWKMIRNQKVDGESLLRETGTPLIVKPAVSGGSMGIGVRNVVHDASELSTLLTHMFEGYRGWDLTTDGLIAERFIAGPEYTVLISGSHDDPANAKIYPPVERVFHPDVPVEERFLSFDRLWEIYEEETAMPEDQDFYRYASPDPRLIERIQQVSWDAYGATKGYGYTRADVRMDQSTGQLYVLEVNAQCGLSEDENYTSIGAILRLSGCTFTSLVAEIIADAIRRHQAKWKSAPV